jgi:hypothetical protein
MSRTSDYNFAVNVAETVEGLCKIDALRFHAFNTNGLCSAAHDAQAALLKAVEEGKVKSGALIAYDVYNRFGYEAIMRQAQRKQPNFGKAKRAIEWVQSDIKKIYEAIAEAHN